MEFEKLLRLMVEKGGSDLFITAGVPPSMKVNGKIMPVTKNALSPEQTREKQLQEQAAHERMLLDRACQTGGWNYGGSNVYGQELWAYVPTTALALLAMQDRRDDPVVAKSLQYLQKDAATEKSAPALAVSLICLRVFGIQAASFEQELIPRLDLSRALGD